MKASNTPATPNHRGPAEQRTGAETGPRLVRETVSGGGTPKTEPWEETARHRAPVGSFVRIGFGALWLIDAGMKWTPGFQSHFADIVKAGGGGQPPWLASWYRFWEALIGTNPGLFALGTAIVETLIAVALLLGFARMWTYILGALWSFGIWAVPEGFGTDDRAMSTDLGTGIVYVVVFLALLALDYSFRARPWSLDAVIERHLPRWRRIAEVRR